MKASDNVFPKLFFSEGAAHGTPTAGEIAVYAKTDKKLYAKDDAGSEVELGAGIPDAPSDGNLYGRKDGDWEQVTGGGAGADRSTVTAVTSSSGVVTLNYALGDYFTLALSEDVSSWVISNPPGTGKGFTLMVQITQDSTPRTVAKPGTTAGGAALDVSTGSGAIDLLAISSFDNATTLRSTIAKAFS